MFAKITEGHEKMFGFGFAGISHNHKCIPGIYIWWYLKKVKETIFASSLAQQLKGKVKEKRTKYWV